MAGAISQRPAETSNFFLSFLLTKTFIFLDM